MWHRSIFPALPGAAAAAGLLHEAHALDRHAAIDCLAHVVNREQRDFHGQQRLHLHAGLAVRLDGGAAVHGALFLLRRQFDFHARDRQWVAQGNHSGVCLAAMMPATRATASTSPFLWPAVWMRRKVAAFMRMRPAATATRWVMALADTSTMRASPFLLRWVSLAMRWFFRVCLE